MLFSSLFFLYAFLPLILIFFFPIKNTSYRRILLVIFSLIFYAWGEPIYVFLMIGTVILNYIFGRMIESPRFSVHSKLWTAVAVIINLALLGIFKYTDFFLDFGVRWIAVALSFKKTEWDLRGMISQFRKTLY